MRKFKIRIDGKVHHVEVEEVREDAAKDEVRGQPVRMPGMTAPSKASLPSAELQEGGGVLAPMAGKILDIKKKEGDACTEDEILFVMESMKMEIYVRAQKSCIIKKIFVEHDSFVEANALLAEVG